CGFLVCSHGFTSYRIGVDLCRVSVCFPSAANQVSDGGLFQHVGSRVVQVFEHQANAARVFTFTLIATPVRRSAQAGHGSYRTIQGANDVGQADVLGRLLQQVTTPAASL